MPKNSSAARREEARRLAAQEGISYTAALRRLAAPARFFDAPVAVESELDEPTVVPPWECPPKDMRGGLVPLGRVAARSHTAFIEVRSALAFPEGCLFDVRVLLRNPGADEDDWWQLMQGSRRHSRRRSRTGQLPDELLRFGVSFPDGAKATTVEGAPSERPDDVPPTGPVLTSHNGGGSSSGRMYESSSELWLWPLPPPRPFDLVTEWPGAEIELTRLTLDGAAIVAAAEQARPYWPED